MLHRKTLLLRKKNSSALQNILSVYQKTLQSQGLNVKVGKRYNISQNKDGTIQYTNHENVNIFKKFYSELAGGPVKKLSIARKRINSTTTKDSYPLILNYEKKQYQLLNLLFKDIAKKLLPCLLLIRIRLQEFDLIKFLQSF